MKRTITFVWIFLMTLFVSADPVVSRGEGKGFVIVSGDDCMPEILGYTESGDFDENDMPEAFREWLQGQQWILSHQLRMGLGS